MVIEKKKIVPFRRLVLADGGCDDEFEVGRVGPCDLKEKIHHLYKLFYLHRGR
jgi:hypothetical protein